MMNELRKLIATQEMKSSDLESKNSALEALRSTLTAEIQAVKEENRALKEEIVEVKGLKEVGRTDVDCGLDASLDEVNGTAGATYIMTFENDSFAQKAPTPIEVPKPRQKVPRAAEKPRSRTPVARRAPEPRPSVTPTPRPSELRPTDSRPRSPLTTQRPVAETLDRIRTTLIVPAQTAAVCPYMKVTNEGKEVVIANPDRKFGIDRNFESAGVTFRTLKFGAVSNDLEREPVPTLAKGRNELYLMYGPKKAGKKRFAKRILTEKLLQMRRLLETELLTDGVSYKMNFVYQSATLDEEGGCGNLYVTEFVFTRECAGQVFAEAEEFVCATFSTDKGKKGPYGTKFFPRLYAFELIPLRAGRKTDDGGRTLIVVMSTNQVREWTVQSSHEKLNYLLDSILFQPSSEAIAHIEVSAEARQFFASNKAFSFDKHVYFMLPAKDPGHKIVYATLSLAAVLKSRSDEGKAKPALRTNVSAGNVSASLALAKKNGKTKFMTETMQRTMSQRLAVEKLKEVGEIQAKLKVSVERINPRKLHDDQAQRLFGILEKLTSNVEQALDSLKEFHS
eukprot:TRINITY_DN3436_c0_g1_i1.p1 TRINITY_DN3436_c0_g1~~TRINITY_DN3436_c0_g1_i1.p1  ORF type:complete len:564 (-),score=115.75 TRINITY_DN3436_c0_g1_i1:183-1874(-)